MREPAKPEFPDLGLLYLIVVTVCPPVFEYSREFQARAADELDMLPEGSAIAKMLSDYSVMREQARACH
ncbi:hypothetical protein [Jannaschia formosa]|uniref:hypothetical protein n=1 Tax=Jannaschia formosa TaxID=2259592 RepID=UPI000E1B92E7|nr:hypothetical protein [Jannaschia formosa]TFL17229.1 hypothetical protein DR046_15460 [Jannaschia formosa]